MQIAWLLSGNNVCAIQDIPLASKDEISSCNLRELILNTRLFSISSAKILSHSDGLFHFLCLISYSGARCHFCNTAPVPQADNHPVTWGKKFHSWRTRRRAVVWQPKAAVLWAENRPLWRVDPERLPGDSRRNRWGKTLLHLIRGEVWGSLCAASGYSLNH